MSTDTTVTTSGTATVKLEVWLQYRSDLATRITQSNWRNGKNEKDRKQIIKTFMRHMAMLQLNKHPVQSTEIIWGSGQIRAAWIVDETAPLLNVLRRRIAEAMALIARSKNLIPKCAAISFRQNGEVLTNDTMPLPKDPRSMAEALPHAMENNSRQTETKSPSKVPNAASKKRKREDEAAPSKKETRKRAHNASIQTDTVVNTVTTGSRASPAPRFIPVSPVAPGSQDILTFSATATNKPFDAYVLPPRSFQQYALDLSEVHKERALVLATRLAKVRTELAETKSQATASIPEHQAESYTKEAQLEEPMSKRARTTWLREEQNFDDEWRAKDRRIEQYATEAHVKGARINRLMTKPAEEKKARGPYLQESKKLKDELSTQSNKIEQYAIEIHARARRIDELEAKLATEQQARETLQRDNEKWSDELRRLRMSFAEERLDREALQQAQNEWDLQKLELLTELSKSNDKCFNMQMELEVCQSELAVAIADRKLMTKVTHSGQRQLATLQEVLRNERQQLLDERETRIRAEAALVNEQTARIQLETQLKSLEGIAPATVPSLMEAFARLAHLTDKVMPI